MTSQTTNSPQIYARIGGALYLFIIIAGFYDEVFVRSTLIVAGDAAATAQKIIASESLFRVGVVGDLLMHVFDVPATLILYVLLRPVSKELSLLAAVFSMLQTAILVANKLNLITVLLLLKRTDSLQAFEPHQLQALASLSLSLHEYGFAIGLIFFGISCLCAGYLIFRSGYLPRAIGALQVVAGLCYLVNSFALLLAPAVAAKMFPAILLPAFLGELSTSVWLLVRGVNASKWDERLRLGPIRAVMAPDSLA